MTTPIPRYEANDEATRNLRYRLYRYINPGWTMEGDIVITPPIGLTGERTLSGAALGTGALGV